jgi:competence protein ComEA
MRGWEIQDTDDDVDVDEFADVGRHAERVVGLPPDPADPPRPPVLAAFNPGRRGIKALIAVAVTVFAIAGFFTWRARPQATPVVAASAVSDGSTGNAGSFVPSSPTPSTVVVAVNGRVRKPGLVRLPAGARVADALDAAGGVLPGTDVAYLNLARKVVDGELILVGVTPPPGAAGPSTGSTAGGLVNLNTATLAELQTLPGIGEVIAQRIIDYRDQHGQFRSINELRQVSGIGAAKFAQLKDKVTV